MMKTSLCKILDLDLPIIQAPIGSATTPELAAAVSNSGGLGMLSVTWRTTDEIITLIQQTKALTDKPFGVNLVLEFDIMNKLKVCLDEGVKIISFFWGAPDQYIDLVHQAGAVVMHSVGNTKEAKNAAQAGADVIVAQGWESGGHVKGDISTMVLVPAVVDTVAPLPVVAAGGIADGRGILAALALGASGVWLGTRFLASQEAKVHKIYQEKVITAKVEDTVHSTLFNIGWENAPHRTLRNSTVEIWEAAGCPQQGNRPKEGEILGYTSRGDAILRYSDTIPLPDIQGHVEALAFYAGQSTGLINNLHTSSQIITQLVNEVEAAYQYLKKVL
ncbi:MAG: nitronate monooxygenase [Xenococcaceae cyanobacterium MO_188.B29]|nr:nitronate monooxygenase [Xenococcaceae cyanobacterium MO_188.B29]